MVICLERGADLHTAQLMPLPLTVSCFSKIQIGFTFLVLAHPGSFGKRAVKRVFFVYGSNSPHSTSYAMNDAVRCSNSCRAFGALVYSSRPRNEQLSDHYANGQMNVSFLKIVW